MKLGDNTDCVLSNFIVDTDIILWLGRVSQIMAKTKTLPLNQKFDMRKIRYLSSYLCDMSRTVCWPNCKWIFHEMVIAVFGTNLIAKMTKTIWS